MRIYDALRNSNDDDLMKNYQESCFILLLKKLQSGYTNKRLITANHEFLRAQKLILRNLQPGGKIELKGIESMQKINIFDEIKFSNDLHRIRYLQVGSEVDNNFMLITIDGSVYKYDLATRDLLFSFKTQAMKSMLLYDKDRRLVVADTQ